MTTAPILGRLLVERSSLLGSSETTLDRVPVGVPVTATAKIAGVRTSSGRVSLILDDEWGGSASVIIESSRVVAAFRTAGAKPEPGVRVQLHGAVTPPVAKCPKGIQAHAIRVVK
ncbi:hypothetical protein [Streptomyces bugieae]|uniref:DNA-binding protein n=1 Tax=Streptomyces bugieae TaxID=3098223 RepID=A0ABU7NKZ8_9ACTN|nr:hypothetical protein [Streptomyces sp. DSM 41528]